MSGCYPVDKTAPARHESAETKPDVLIAGNGSAAFSAAITASEMGAQVVMTGQGVIGGTCVNTGCVPSKTLIRAMQAVHDSNAANRFDGVHATSHISDWKAVVQQKRALVEHLRHTKYEDLLAQYPRVSYRNAAARFAGPNAAVEVEGKLYHPRKVILATGASPTLPSIDGIETVPVLDSAKALELEKLPDSLLVIGGGFIGVEMGQMFARAGVAVTICCRRRLLPDAEPEVTAALAEYLRQEGVTVCHGVAYRRIENARGGVALTLQTPDGQRIIEAEHVLAATGRKPNTASLRLENAGIARHDGGGIAVNEFMQTSHPDVYAVGDVTGKDMFVYMAAYGGKLAAQNALHGNRFPYDNAAMPSVVFTDPQVAAAGLTAREAKAKGQQVITSVVSLDNVPRYIAARDTRGLIKLVADEKSDKLLGASILAPEAGDSIQTVIIALKAGLTTKQLAETIFPYLTAVEGIKLAAQAFAKDVKKLSCCAG